MNERVFYNMDYIFCLLGKSASGKDTIMNMIMSHKISKDETFWKSNNITLSKMVPITSRPPRPSESDGVGYNFLTTEYFRSLISENSLLEYRKYDVKTSDNKDDVWYYGHRYPSDKFNIMIGTLEAYGNILKMPIINKYKIIPIYIDVPDEDRLFRLIGRENKSPNPNYRELCRRFFKDNEDFSKENLSMLNIDDSCTFDNIDFTRCLDGVYEYIKNIIKTELEEK